MSLVATHSANSAAQCILNFAFPCFPRPACGVLFLAGGSGLRAGRRRGGSKTCGCNLDHTCYVFAALRDSDGHSWAFIVMVFHASVRGGRAAFTDTGYRHTRRQGVDRYPALVARVSASEPTGGVQNTCFLASSSLPANRPVPIRDFAMTALFDNFPHIKRIGG